jgi:hypothetical protein
MLKKILKDLYNVEFNNSEKEFIKDLDSLEKKDKIDIEKEYLSSAILDFFKTCSKDTLENFKEFTNIDKSEKKYSVEELDIGDDFDVRDDDEKDIENKFPKKIYGITFVKGILENEEILQRLNKNDDFRFDYNKDDLMFLRDLNMIGNDDFELKTLENEYLSAGIYNYFTETAVSVDKDMQYYLSRDEEKFIDDDVDIIPGVTVPLNEEEEKDDLFSLL